MTRRMPELQPSPPMPPLTEMGPRPLTLRPTRDALMATAFGGRRVRRVPVALGEEGRLLLLHEDKKGLAYLLGEEAPGAERLALRAEWGEGLGEVEGVESDPDTGQVLAFLVRGRDLPPTRVPASDTFWWQGELYCQRRRATELRQQRRQARARRTPGAA